VIQIGACRIRGSFTIPPGVSVKGLNPFVSTLEVPEDEIGVNLCATDTPSRLEDLRVVSREGRAAVLVLGNGVAELQDVVVRAERGVGIVASDVGELSMQGVRIRGPVDFRNADGVDHDAVPSQIATHGLVAFNVQRAEFERVSTGGFALFGAVLMNSLTRWEGGGGSGNVGTGLMVWGGAAELRDLWFRNTFSGQRPDGDYPAAFAFAAGTQVTTEDLWATRSEGWGFFHDSVTLAEHEDLRAFRNDHAGVWHQNGGSLLVEDSTMLLNDFGGIVAVDSDKAMVEDSRILGTREATRTHITEMDGFQIAETSATTAGDGVHLARTYGTLTDVRLINNERIGIWSKVRGIAPCLTPREHVATEDVGIVATRDQLGAIFQHGEDPPRLITEGVRRLGLAERNDQAYLDKPFDLDVAEGIVPCLLPRAAELEDGFDVITGPVDHPLS
jgi:hypothetical protein